MMKRSGLWLSGAFVALLVVVLGAVSAQAESDRSTQGDSDRSTQFYGTYRSDSTDSGTCGNDWANDTFKRSFVVHKSGSSYTVYEFFTDGAFTTLGGFSPGACESSTVPQGTVLPNIHGSMGGFFVIPLPAGTVQTSTSRSCVAGVPTAPCTTQDFIDTHFTPCYGIGTCPVTSFYFGYDARDQGLIQRHWVNASADLGGNRGDIRSFNI